MLNSHRPHPCLLSVPLRLRAGVVKPKGPAMNLADAIAQTAPRKGPRFSTGKILEDVTDEQRAELEQALANADIQTANLSRAIALAHGGKPIDPQSLGKHRKGECGCVRTD